MPGQLLERVDTLGSGFPVPKQFQRWKVPEVPEVSGAGVCSRFSGEATYKCFVVERNGKGIYKWTQSTAK